VYNIGHRLNGSIEEVVQLGGKEQPLKAGDFALVNLDEEHQYQNKIDKPFKMICGEPKDFEL